MSHQLDTSFVAPLLLALATGNRPSAFRVIMNFFLVHLRSLEFSRVSVVNRSTHGDNFTLRITDLDPQAPHWHSLDSGRQRHGLPFDANRGAFCFSCFGISALTPFSTF
jgi:hypothetical protein